MIRIAVCSLVLSAFVFGLGHFMTSLSEVMELSSFALLCGLICAVMISLGFAWDWFERSRVPQSQLSTPPDRRQLER